MNRFEQIKAEIMEMVFNSEYHRLRPHEIEKSLFLKMDVHSYTAKEALEELIKEGVLVYTYRDPCSYVEYPFCQL